MELSVIVPVKNEQENILPLLGEIRDALESRCEYEVIYIARSDGHMAADVRPLVRLNVSIIAGLGDRQETGSYGVGGRNGNNWGRIGTPDYAAYFNGSVRVTTLGHVTGNLPVYATAAGVLTTSSSDTRLKKNVAALTDAVDVVAALAKLRGVTFNWDTSVARARDLGEQQEIGMIAQEVEAVLPQVVGTGADGYRSLDYAKLTAFLIEVAKAQQAEIDELRAALGMPRKPGSR